ncbi:MAG: lipopolysaccharide heptosyltransferase family protein [Calditrichaeota bacterium]|nr:MAG: lipopolysaccharide heptosyltransferase family protein [Calditrichota bacterium]
MRSKDEKKILWEISDSVGHRFRKRRFITNVILPQIKKHHWASAVAPAVHPQTLLLVRIDLIGDYILFRNFLRYIRNSERYRNYTITLCGNIVYKNLAESLDQSNVDHFIWVDRDRFIKDKSYYLQMMEEIHSRGFETALQPTFSREIYGDLLIYASQAPECVGVMGDDSQERPDQKAVTDTFYHRLIQVSETPRFEFERNREIISAFINQEIECLQPTLEFPNSTSFTLPNEKYAVIVPGASSHYKTWLGFDHVVTYLRQQYGLFPVIVGHGKADRKRIRALIKKLTPPIINYCDKTTLVELAFLLKHAAIVISNDTAAMHMAAAQGTRTICVTSGSHAFRFNHYPENFNNWLRFIFPPQMEELKKTGQFTQYASDYKNNIPIHSITVARVCSAADELLQDAKE